MKYLVTTQPIPIDRPVIMVDGTVPGWVFKEGDRHFDHHRPGGAPIQIDEIPASVASELTGDEVFLTTQVDADACVAAAWCQMSHLLSEEQTRKLRAIAWDCDHLMVPEELADLTDFAAQAVATLKQDSYQLVERLGLPKERKHWTQEQRVQYSSTAFERGTQWLIAALKEERSFPGEKGEATEYWQQVEHRTQQLVTEQRIIFSPTPQGRFPVCDTRGLNGYIDPRCFLRAITNMPDLLPMTLTVRDYRDGRLSIGYSYTLGCIPTHESVKHLDYTQSTFTALTEAERLKNPQSDLWGGRATVGGSPWNNPSQLTIDEIVAIVCRSHPI